MKLEADYCMTTFLVDFLVDSFVKLSFSFPAYFGFPIALHVRVAYVLFNNSMKYNYLHRLLIWIKASLSLFFKSNLANRAETDTTYE